MKNYKDITGLIGPLYRGEEPEFTMYSYDRPAYNFWQGFYEGLIDRGFSHKKALEEMGSKGVRWMLDGDADKLKDLGKEMAKTYNTFCK